jgi:hypothetical protein
MVDDYLPVFIFQSKLRRPLGFKHNAVKFFCEGIVLKLILLAKFHALSVRCQLLNCLAGASPPSQPWVTGWAI